MAMTVDSGGESVVDDLRHALKHLADEYLPGMDVTELGALSVELTESRRQLDGVIAAVVAEAARAGVPASVGQRTMAQYIASRTHERPAVIRSDERVGRWVSSLRLIEEAMLDEEALRDMVSDLRRLENIRVAMAMRRDQHLLRRVGPRPRMEVVRERLRVLAQGECRSLRSLTELFAYRLTTSDQDGPEPYDEEAINTFNVRRLPDGRVRGTFDLDPVTGEIVMQQIGVEENALFNEDQENGIPRTVPQRRAKAFANLVRRGANRSTESAKPLIHVVMSLKVLQNAIAQMAKDPQEQDFTSVLDPSDPDGRCELIDGTPIHPNYALVLLMQARVRRQVLTAKNITLEASYETRLFPDWMHYIRLVESRGQCAAAGCDAHHSWLHKDHRQPRSKQGPTALDNLDPLCGPDNRFKSDGPPLPGRS